MGILCRRNIRRIWRKHDYKQRHVISSWDSDFFQLISENVRVLRYRGKNTVLCDEEFIESKFEIAPAQYADFKSLVGDKADNIKGAEKIGPKTASALLRQFGGLQEIIDNIDAVERKCVRESLAGDKERLLLNYKVIKLDGRAAIPFPIEELKYINGQMKTKDVLSGIGL